MPQSIHPPRLGHTAAAVDAGGTSRVDVAAASRSASSLCAASNRAASCCIRAAAPAASAAVASSRSRSSTPSVSAAASDWRSWWAAAASACAAANLSRSSAVASVLFAEGSGGVTPGVMCSSAHRCQLRMCCDDSGVGVE